MLTHDLKKFRAKVKPSLGLDRHLAIEKQGVYFYINPLLSLKRNRLQYFIALIVVIFFGLTSRQEWVPFWLYPYLGDTLYALMCYMGFAFIFRRWAPLKIAGLSFMFCVLIEFSQLYQAPWLNEIRSYRLGALILGNGFLVSDLFCYALGVSVALLLEEKALKQKLFIGA